MKMTRNRNFGGAGQGETLWKALKSFLFAAVRRAAKPLPVALASAAVLAAGLTAPALAQEGEGVAIELNKLEPLEGACRAYLVVKNGSGGAFESLKLDLVMFDSAGVVTKRLAVQAGPLPEGKTSLKVFDITEHDCPDIGSILLNDVLECTPAPEAAGGCLAMISVTGRAEVPFIK